MADRTHAGTAPLQRLKLRTLSPYKFPRVQNVKHRYAMPASNELAANGRKPGEMAE
jgi:hypothetical protein